MDLNSQTATTFLGLQNCGCKFQIVNFLNTLGSRSWYKGGGLNICSSEIDTLSPCMDIKDASILVLLGLDIITSTDFKTPVYVLDRFEF